MNLNKALYDVTTENAIIGYILNFPSLLLEEEFPLNIDDFQNQRNKIVYGAANNLAIEGVNKISPADLDIYLRRFPEQYSIYERNQGIESLMTMTQENDFLDKAKFKILYERLKKFAILRDFERAGISTDEFYTDDIFSEKIVDFEKLTIEDFVKKIKDKVNDIEEKYQNKSAAKGICIAEGLRDLIEEFKVTPAIGSELDGEIYNYAVRGARLGKMFISSSNSGGGKTRRMVGQACALALPYINDAGQIVTKTEYKPALFISTEQSVQEIQTLVLSYVSGVNEAKITDGLVDCSSDELNRIELAIKIIELFKDYLMLEQIPDPSIGLLKSKMLQYIYKKNVQYIFFDYIFSSPSLLAEFQTSKLREDVVLLMLTNAIKEIATVYNVFIMSGTQITGDFNKPEFRGINFLRGSKAIADKIDCGDVTCRLMPEEMEQVRPIFSTMNCEPNIVRDIYKNRSGALTQIKIFSHFDFGTCRLEDYFMTDLDYNVIAEFRKLKQERQYLTTIEDLKQVKGEMENG